MCLYPQKVIQYTTIDSFTGEVKNNLRFFNQNANFEKILDNMLFENKKIIEVPCNCCIECLQEHSRMWTYRIKKESEYYKDNCMITLTYKTTDGELNKRDFQLFMKRLRKKIAPIRIRFFACGEYGSKGQRPHFHVIIFNYKPTDLKVLKYDKSGIIYTSKEIETIWKNGFISVIELTNNSIKYCSKYLQKLNNYSDKKIKPFFLMSNRPGIGFNYFNENKDILLKTDRIYDNGYFIKLPRYYLKLAEKNYDLSTLKENRILRFNLNKPFVNLELKKYRLKKLFNKLI